MFAIGGVAAALAGVLSGVYFSSIDPSRGTSLLIFAFIVVVIGGLGSLGGSAIAAVLVGLVQQYANYYASSGLGDISRRAPARRRAPAPPVRARRAESEGRMRTLARCRWCRSPCSRCSPPCRSSRSTRTASSRAPLDSPGTLQLLALCLLFGGLALTYDLLFGYTGLLSFGHALYFATGVYVADDRRHEVALGACGPRSP